MYYLLAGAVFVIINCLTQALLFEEPNGGTERVTYLVLQIQTLGFANRVRVMADMNLAASLSDRQLIISWEPTLDCNVNITDIFEEIPDNVKVLPFVLPHGAKGADLVKALSLESKLTFYDMEHEGFLLPRDALFDESIDVVFSNYNGVASVEGIPCELYMYARSQFYSLLVPKKEILDTVNYISNTYFNKHIMVGVHYRNYDPVFDWNVVPPTGKMFARLVTLLLLIVVLNV